MPSFNPDNWYDLLAYLIVGLPACVAAIGAWRGLKGNTKSHKFLEKTSKEVLNEVKNDHATNLRDDIDGLAVAIREGFSHTNEQIHHLNQHIHHLRVDVQTERTERIEGDKK
jgi:hypothetical protein